MDYRLTSNQITNKAARVYHADLHDHQHRPISLVNSITVDLAVHLCGDRGGVVKPRSSWTAEKMKRSERLSLCIS
jgi:hypothetical protein